MFLKLRQVAPGVFAVPPVDVDFVWHTQMSMTAQYHQMSMQHFGKLVSHETVSPEDSAKTFKRDVGFGGTQRAWAELFPGEAESAPFGLLLSLSKLQPCTNKECNKMEGFTKTSK